MKSKTGMETNWLDVQNPLSFTEVFKTKNHADSLIGSKSLNQCKTAQAYQIYITCTSNS